MNTLDIIGAVIGLFYIVSEYRADRWFWPLCLLMSLFYIIIDFSAHYYANGTICCYNFVMSIYGLLVWRGVLRSANHNDKDSKQEEIPISSCPRKYWPGLLLAQVLGALKESHQPWIDGLTSAISIVGMFMVSQKWWQQWFCWMVVNPLMVYLFFVSGNYASAILYVVYCVFCILGVVKWKKESIS